MCIVRNVLVLAIVSLGQMAPMFAGDMALKQQSETVPGAGRDHPTAVPRGERGYFDVEMELSRVGMPLGNAPLIGRCFQVAERKPGPNAVDWPTLTYFGEPLFKDAPRQTVRAPWYGARCHMIEWFFRQPGDPVIEPINHWLRPQFWSVWFGDQTSIYTTDHTARTAGPTGGKGGYYELWSFPVIIRGKASNAIKSVELKLRNQSLYSRQESLQSLTLLLPANLCPEPYVLTVNGGNPVEFHVGCEPFEPGVPRYVFKKVHAELPDGIVVCNLDVPERFPNWNEWEKDVAAMKSFQAPPRSGRQARSMEDYLGIEVDRSPVKFVAAFMEFGMSAGFFRGCPGQVCTGTPEEYARHLKRCGFDLVCEPFGRKHVERDGIEWYQRWMAALEREGIRGGFHPNEINDSTWGAFSYGIPEYNLSSYRYAQLLMQAFKHRDNLAGIVFGGENGGYEPMWVWAGPVSERPWGRAVNQLHGNKFSRPMPKTLGGSSTVRAFQDYCENYEKIFSQYGHMRDAMAAVDPELVITTGSFGKGVGHSAGDGWGECGCVPPGKLFKDLDVALAYDWNEWPRSLPGFHAALQDQLRAYHPDKPRWAIVDNFCGFMSGPVMWREYAMALTRGPAVIGSNTVPFNSPSTTPWIHQKYWYDMGSWNEVRGFYKEIGDWVRRYGGTYSMTRPNPPIAVYYDFRQARCRRAERGSWEPEKWEYFRKNGSHGGKATEALFLAHAAGWSAQLVTPNLLKRGLPEHVKVLYLAGLDRLDDSWVWYEGLEGALRRFVDRGGEILSDDQSVCPVASTKTGMSFCPYISGTFNAYPILVERNRENIRKLQAAMKGTGIAPLATCEDPYVWTVPAIAGNTEYVTVLNQHCQRTKADPAGIQRVDGDFNIAIGLHRPHPGIREDNYEIEWTGQIRIPTNGEYAFMINLEDHAKNYVQLWIDEEPVLERDAKEMKDGMVWLNGAGKRNLTAGRHDIRIRYKHSYGVTIVQVKWQPPGRDMEIIPADMLFATKDASEAGGLTGTYRQLVGLMNCSRHIDPATAKLAWDTGRPIYDVRKRKKVSPEEASECDLTRDSFQYYALPAAEVRRPELAVRLGDDGFYVATTEITNPEPMTGIPLQFDVQFGEEKATVYGATGLSAKLPVADFSRAGEYRVRVTELLSGLSASEVIKIAAGGKPRPSSIEAAQAKAIAGFKDRKEIPLVIALTPDQVADSEVSNLARQLEQYYLAAGRQVKIDTVEQNRLVKSLQIWSSPTAYPQWLTVEADLILLGTPRNNLLLFDQARAGILRSGDGIVDYTYSPFVAGCDALNILGGSPEALAAAVSFLR